MAEASYVDVDVPEGPDSDVLPDGVEEEKGLTIFDMLDAGNLVDELEDPVRDAEEILRLFDEATESMKDWKKLYTQAMKLAKLEPDAKEKTFPFPKASNVMMPFILEAMLDFHSRTVPELVWATDVVAMKTWGEDSKKKSDRATRTAEYMNYQVTQTIDHGTWRKEQDKMLLGLPCGGTAYKRTCFDYDHQEPSSGLLQGDQVIFNHNYRTFEEAPDKFLEEEWTRNEIIGFIRGKCDWRLDEDKLPLERDHPEPFEFVRAYCWLDLDDDGLDEPYEVVIYREDDSIVSVRPAYDEDTIIPNDDGEIVNVAMLPIFTQYQFLPDPDGGPMGLGWGILLSDLFHALNTSVRQMIDAGTLQNLAGNSGLIDHQLTGMTSRGNRQQAGPVEVRLGEFTPVSTGGKPLSQSIVQLPHQGPSATLFELTQWMLTQVRDMTNSALNMDTNSQEAAMMYLARLQQGLKVPNSIVMRVYNNAREEFTKIAAINFKHYNNSKYNKVLDGNTEYDMRKDFDPEDCDMRPAIDPSQGSDIERQQRASIVLEEAKTQTSQVINVRQAYLDWGAALKVPDIELLMPEPSGKPDPMEQLMIANMEREADLAERKQQVEEQQLELKRLETMLKAQKEGAEMGIQLDVTESEIAQRYAETFKALWEIGMAGDDPIATVQTIEGRLIDNQPGAKPPSPLPPPDPNPQQAAPAGGQQQT